MDFRTTFGLTVVLICGCWTIPAVSGDLHVPMPAALEVVATRPAGLTSEAELAEWRAAFHEEALRCDLADGRHVQAVPVAPEQQDWSVSVAGRGGQLTQDFSPEVPSGLVAKGWKTVPGLACDTEVPRIYFGHPWTGNVRAFKTDGAELWMRALPGFKPLQMQSERPPIDVDSIQALREQDGAFIQGRAYTSGPYVAFEYRSPDQAWHQAIYHRSGTLVASLGHWNGFIGRTIDRGWLFYVGGEELPSHEIDVIVRDHAVDGVIEHSLAWLMPWPGDTQYTFRVCRGAPLDKIHPALGEAWSEEFAARSRTLLGDLGAKWFAELAQERNLMPVMQTYVEWSPSWLAQFRLALFEAGVDVEFARKLDEGQSPTPD